MSCSHHQTCICLPADPAIPVSAGSAMPSEAPPPPAISFISSPLLPSTTPRQRQSQNRCRGRFPGRYPLLLAFRMRSLRQCWQTAFDRPGGHPLHNWFLGFGPGLLFARGSAVSGAAKHSRSPSTSAGRSRIRLIASAACSIFCSSDNPSQAAQSFIFPRGLAPQKRHPFMTSLPIGVIAQ